MYLETEVIRTVISVIILVSVGRLLGMVCSRFRMPKIIGYVIAGIILGPYALGGQIILYEHPLIELNVLLEAFSQIAAIIILFSAGLHFTTKDLRKVGLKAAVVSGVEFLLSVSVAYYVSVFFGLDWITASIIAATFGATSVAISVTVLEDLGKEKTEESKLLVNTAVLDDILGLALLSAVTTMVLTHSSLNITDIVLPTVEALVFWMLLVITAVFFLPKILHIGKIRGSEATTDVTVIGSAFGFSTIAALLGLNPIVGSFAAGMGLAGSHINKHVLEYIKSLKFVAAPLFFTIIGAQIDLNQIWNINGLLFIALLACAVTTKIIGAGVPSSFLLKSKSKGFKVGFGMVGRSEVAFITAGVGLSSGIIDNGIYSTLAFIILITAFISPLLLRQSYSKAKKPNHAN